MTSQPPAIPLVRTSPVAENLRVAQALAKVSNKQLATACGVTEKTVSRWRHGGEIAWRDVVKVAQTLGREPLWFYTRHEIAEDAA